MFLSPDPKGQAGFVSFMATRPGLAVQKSASMLGSEVRKTRLSQNEPCRKMIRTSESGH
jgi:hypothetical protein